MVVENTQQQQKSNVGDIDIDVFDRDQVLSVIEHVPASIIKDNTIEKHNTGVYIQNVPTDPTTGLCSLDYNVAEELGYVKLDLLNLGAYKDIKSIEHLEKLIEQEPDWSLLEHKEIVESLYHIHNHFNIVSKLKPKSVEQLAMTLAIIRPGKRHLLNKSWSEIEKEVWVKDDTDKFTFKKSHSFSYAMLIVMQLNQLVEQA